MLLYLDSISPLSFPLFHATRLQGGPGVGSVGSAGSAKPSDSPKPPVKVCAQVSACQACVMCIACCLGRRMAIADAVRVLLFRIRQDHGLAIGVQNCECSCRVGSSCLHVHCTSVVWNWGLYPSLSVLFRPLLHAADAANHGWEGDLVAGCDALQRARAQAARQDAATAKAAAAAATAKHSPTEGQRPSLPAATPTYGILQVQFGCKHGSALLVH